MGELLQKFTIDRNFLRSSEEESADKAFGFIKGVEEGKTFDTKADTNALGAYMSYMGLFRRENNIPQLTDVAHAFVKLATQHKVDAWRWLLTRSLWLLAVPNGTGASVNQVATALHIHFSLFQALLQLCAHLAAFDSSRRFLYFEELLDLLSDDDAWKHTGHDLFERLLARRSKTTIDPTQARRLLGDLEDQYNIPRDNWNTFLVKALKQIGLFEFSDGVAIALRSDLDPVLQKRVRFVLDNPTDWDALTSWQDYISLRQSDLPLDISVQAEPHDEHEELQPPPDLSNLVEAAASALNAANFDTSVEQVKRFAASLLAKRFVILTGLSGSGKTRLAQLFALWMGPKSIGAEDFGRMRVVAVGADWTAGDYVLGYPDALDADRFVKTDALKLILEADVDQANPYFLILDEMNLSHVEKYFSDFLSAIESGEKIRLHSDSSDRDGVPNRLPLPRNLFVVGTVNIDESTYQFSPKVLDRANVIEFRPNESQVVGFISKPNEIDKTAIAGLGESFAQPFAFAANTKAGVAEDDKGYVIEELSLVYRLLDQHGFEFAFRTVREISRFIHFHKALTNETEAWDVRAAMDAQVIQKLLPKLNGSRARLESLLCALGAYTYQTPTADASTSKPTRKKNVIKLADEWQGFRGSTYPPLERLSSGEWKYDPTVAYFPLSFAKVQRMLRNLKANGFVSFSEA